jgi:hypothetical protein
MGIRTCRELLAVEYGSELQTRIQESTVIVGTTPVNIVAGNGARIWVSIQNTGTATVFVTTLGTGAAMSGFVVLGGGSLWFNWKQDNDFPTVALYASSMASNVPINIIEQILTGSGL